jgi:hypothetical protein
MRSTRGGLFSVVEGPCKRYAMAPTRMSGHNCLPGPQTVSMRSMRGGFIFRNWGPSLKVHRCQCLTSMTKHDSRSRSRSRTLVDRHPGCSPGGNRMDKTRGSTSGWQSLSAGGTHTIRTAHMFFLTPGLLLLCPQTLCPPATHRTHRMPSMGEALGPGGCSVPPVERTRSRSHLLYASHALTVTCALSKREKHR